MKIFLLRTLMWIGAVGFLIIAGLAEAEIYNQIMLSGLGSESYQSGWHFVSVFMAMIPILILSSILAAFGNMERVKSSPLKLFTITSQCFMFFLWLIYITTAIVYGN